MDAKVPPQEAHKLNSDGSEYSPYEKEEIFEQDGTVEDIIAVDYKSTCVLLPSSVEFGANTK